MRTNHLLAALLLSVSVGACVTAPDEGAESTAIAVDGHRNPGWSTTTENADDPSASGGVTTAPTENWLQAANYHIDYATNDATQFDDPTSETAPAQTCNFVDGGACARACDPSALIQIVPLGTCGDFTCHTADGTAATVGICNERIDL